MLAASHHHRLVLELIPSHSLFRWLVWIRRSRGNGWVLLQRSGVLPEHWTNGMLGFPPTEENQHEEEQIYR